MELSICIMRNLMKDRKGSKKRLTEGLGLVWGFGNVSMEKGMHSETCRVTNSWIVNRAG